MVLIKLGSYNSDFDILYTNQNVARLLAIRQNMFIFSYVDMY